jgi:hypothetical protein
MVMNYASLSDDDGFPEIKIQVYKFNIMEYSVHCILLDTQYEVMKEFFEDISTGKILWEDAKSKAIMNLHKAEYPNMTEDQIEKIYKINPSVFARSNNVFRDLEANASIQNIIREIKINQITD